MCIYNITMPRFKVLGFFCLEKGVVCVYEPFMRFQLFEILCDLRFEIVHHHYHKHHHHQQQHRRWR